MDKNYTASREYNSHHVTSQSSALLVPLTAFNSKHIYITTIPKKIYHPPKGCRQSYCSHKSFSASPFPEIVKESKN